LCPGILILDGGVSCIGRLSGSAIMGILNGFVGEVLRSSV
jgi:hypothetical protein